MERIGVRELRNYASRVVRRARAGERMLITVDGVPAAEIGPVSREPGQQTLEELIAAGLVIPARRTDRPPPPMPMPAPAGRLTREVLGEHRDRR
ncbi:MAG: type II toxin-antitoxin system prevent-host-death family antitoxin [Chloroflexota bacterium]|nr:type II toxin-antitoxin system prevent-host-death family antitoxin [Chloroflexota bacterium]